jgi:23S rRNA pseudouridine2605 synthase
MRLNRFLSHAGICNRREADDLIAAGLVQVNGKVIVTMGYKVQPSDEVKYNGSLIKSEKKKYLVLNKPKGFITSITDKKAKKTVEELVGNACRERLYPVGSMDRTSTGVLLFTNDVDLAKKMAHPKNGAVQIISVVLDKPLQKIHLTAIAKGMELEDGKIDVEEIKYIDERTKREVGLRLHSGKHRLVNRIFDKFGYTIEKMDRVSFAGFTKKNLSRGQWRFLDPKEVDFLKTR